MLSKLLSRQSVLAVSISLCASLGHGASKPPTLQEEYKIPTEAISFNQSYANVVQISAAEMPYRLSAVAQTLKPGTIVELPEGTFDFDESVIINTSHVTLRGKGKDKTVLNFKNAVTGGEGILVLSDAFVIEDLAIEDTKGDGIRVEGADGVVFRDIRVEWTAGPQSSNGAYGIYPVLSKNVLIEDSVVSGASDSGVYVGQTDYAVIRNNIVRDNVAGIEIENTKYADVYNNETLNNTGGVLVFDHPGLSQSGGFVRVYNNHIHDNNLNNFAPGGFLIDFVPEGSGVIVLAMDDVEIFNNYIIGNDSFGLFLFSHSAAVKIAGGSLPDDFEPTSERVELHDNVIQRTPGFRLGNAESANMLNILNLLGGAPDTDIVFDGFYKDPDSATPMIDAQHCLTANNSHFYDDKAVAYSNIHLDKENPFLQQLGIPGLPATPGFTPAHDCDLPALAAVELDLSIFDTVPAPSDEYSDEEVAALCAGGDQDDVNWAAFVVDCPNLSDYRLFEQANDPRGDAKTERGVKYDLNTPLFSDYAEKDRYVFIPVSSSSLNDSASQASYDANNVFNMPIGSIIAKTFTLPMSDRIDKVVETRLLIKRASGWRALPYVWQLDANLTPNNASLALGGALLTQQSIITPAGDTKVVDYAVPSLFMCTSCHGVSGKDQPIGLKARLLNKDFTYNGSSANQLAHWQAQGLLNITPLQLATAPKLAVWNDAGTGSLEERAKAYLETNCAHCHSNGGRAGATGLLLTADTPLDTSYGICKRPVAAGTGSGNITFDINPGQADDSILSFRMNSNDVAVRMPEIGRGVVHSEGLALVNEWINSLSGSCETTP